MTTRPFRIAGRARDEQPTYINLQDRARIKRAFGSMLYAGGMKIHNTKLDDLTFEVLLDTLEELSRRLTGASEHYQAMEAQLRQHKQIFDALKALGQILKEDSDDN